MRVLVVEDEPKMLAFIQQGLEEHRYAVDVVKSKTFCKNIGREVPQLTLGKASIGCGIGGWGSIPNSRRSCFKMAISTSLIRTFCQR